MEPSRINIEELQCRLDARDQLIILNDRWPEAWNKTDSQIPGSIRVPPAELDKHVQEVPLNARIVTYCAWPNKNSSARVARELLERGWSYVHPLAGALMLGRMLDFPVESKKN